MANEFTKLLLVEIRRLEAERNLLIVERKALAETNAPNKAQLLDAMGMTILRLAQTQLAMKEALKAYERWRGK